jgi:hypothetical protein
MKFKVKLYTLIRCISRNVVSSAGQKVTYTVAIRVVRGFCTVVATVAVAIAGFPSFELQVLRCRDIYLRTGVGWVGLTLQVLTLESRRDRTC